MLVRLAVIAMVCTSLAQSGFGEAVAEATGVRPPSLRVVTPGCIRYTPSTRADEWTMSRLYCLV